MTEVREAIKIGNFGLDSELKKDKLHLALQEKYCGKRYRAEANITKEEAMQLIAHFQKLFKYTEYELLARKILTS